MNLILLDIDGTLVHYHSDGSDRAYVDAISQVLGIDVENSWDGYKSSTNTGIANEICARHFGRDLHPDELAELKTALAGVFPVIYPPGRHFHAVEGAPEFVSALGSSLNWRGVIATGNWEIEARLKLKSAGIHADHLPAATSDLADNRPDILRRGVELARQTFATDFERMVYVGDWDWDVRAARETGLEFIGMRNRDNEDVLLHAGATVLVNSYQELAEWIQLL